MTKKEIRARYKGGANCPEFDELIFRRLAGTALYEECSEIFTYIGAGGEVSTAALAERAWSDGKKTAAPCVVGKGEMIFRYFKNWNDLEEGKFGLLEPRGGLELAESSEKTLVIVPAVAFCLENMGRVGHGGGFYDRFLENLKRAAAVGLTYESRLCSFEKEEHDVSVDLILTEKNFYGSVAKI